MSSGFIITYLKNILHTLHYDSILWERKINFTFPSKHPMNHQIYNVLDRIEQAFTLFIKNPLVYILPLAGLNIMAFVIIPEIFMALFWDMILAQSRASTAIIIILMIGSIYAVCYLTLIIPTTLLIIKNAADSYDWKIIDIKENISYSFSNLWKIFSVYWYVFRYVYLLPALVFIAWWFLMLISMITGNNFNQNIWFWIMWIAWIYALIQWIYRWVKSKFALYGAVYNNDFSQEQFSQSIHITDWKWWRIVWNFFVAGFIASLVIWVVSGLINSIWFLWADYGTIIEAVINNSENSKQEVLEKIMWSMSGFSIFWMLKSILSIFTNSLITVFIFIFTLIFYKHLTDEFENLSVVTQVQEGSAVDQIKLNQEL